MEAPVTARRPGRRSARVTAAVHGATLAALAERGLDRLEIEDIAARANVNKTTIYRRWRSRERLVADALAAAVSTRIAAPDTGDVRSDLIALARQVRDVIVSRRTRSLVAALGAGHHHRELDEIRQRYWAERLAAARPIVARAVERGEVAAGTDPDTLLIRVVGPIWFVVFGPGHPADDAFLEGTVDAVLGGVSPS